MTQPSAEAAPVRREERYESLDVLRGVAILGILVMNIQSFSMPMAAYSNPLTYGDFSGINRWIWGLSYVFAAEKFMTLFSILFGAGVALMTSRLETRGLRSAPTHYRRMLWLILIGLLHAYVFWFGDILFAYAVCALWLYLFRRLKPRSLVILGVCVLSIGSLITLMASLSLPYWPEADRAELVHDWQPPAEEISAEVEAYQQGWWRQMAFRVPQAVMLQTVVLLFFILWKAGGLMLIGMALYKWGILTGEASLRTYRWLAAVGFMIGFPLVILGAWQHVRHEFAAEWSSFVGGTFNYWGSAFVSLGYVGVLCLLLLTGRLGGWKDRLAAVGRMALTNYLLQTVLCTTLFYGHGFGLFGRVDRPGQVAIVLAVWALQLVASPLWLQHFRFGPAEWLWRSLTYGKRQPMRSEVG